MLEVGEPDRNGDRHRPTPCTSKRPPRRSARWSRPTTMTTLSLNGRSFTDLLRHSAGRVPMTTMQADSVIMAGVTGAVAPSGQLNPGNLSISGQRESANSFLVNGSDVQERMNGGTSIVPESRFLRSVPRPDEQLRSAVRQLQRRHRQRHHQVRQRPVSWQRVRLHPQHELSTRRTTFRPNGRHSSSSSPAARLAAPSRRARSSSSPTIKATRTTQGIETGVIPVPSMAERGGNFCDAADS